RGHVAPRRWTPGSDSGGDRRGVSQRPSTRRGGAISSDSAMDATYVYCIAHAPLGLTRSRAPAGLPEAPPPRVLDAGGPLWVVCASVPLASYGPGALEPALRDLNWVGDIAVAHESVVEHFAQ